jgi:hypothetical protein
MACFKRSKRKWLALVVLMPLFFGCSAMSHNGSNPEIAAFRNHLETLKDKASKTPLHEYEVGNLSCERGGITMKVNAGDYHYVRLYATCFSSGPLKFTERGRKEAIDLLSKARSLYFRVYTANASVPTLIGTTTEGLEVRLRIIRGTTSGEIALRKFDTDESCNLNVYPHTSTACSIYSLMRLLEAAPSVAAMHFATEGGA